MKNNSYPEFKELNDPNIIMSLGKLQTGVMLGRVKLLNEIGRGNMGVVYSGWHMELDIPVALKFLTYREQGFEEAVSRFRREAKICASLDEPNIIRVLDFANFHGIPYFIMEWVPGQPLTDVIANKEKPFTENEVFTFFRDMGQALMGLHKKSIVHRDIKPSNIILRATDGRMKLADLGVAHDLKDQSLDTQVIIGTPRYMSPEQVQNSAKVTGASDLYSLGLTGYYLLLKDHVIKEKKIYKVIDIIRSEPVPSPQSLNLKVSDLMAEILIGLTRKKTEDRIENAEQLLALLPGISLPLEPETLQAALPQNLVPRQEIPATQKIREEATEVSSFKPSYFHTMNSKGQDPGETEHIIHSRKNVRALLFCQSLQKDFIRPLKPEEKPDCSLHIGWAEAQRLVGPDPAQGPLVQAIKTCSSQDHIGMVFTRDWHNPYAPDQKHELEHFGNHCLMGTEGAKFIDVVEFFSRNRARNVILDSHSINDFEDNDLDEILYPLLGDKPRSEIPVGVIGVWTHVKVHYLLYELKTRGGFQNLATCFALTASPNPADHVHALDHFQKNLNIKVFSTPPEFLSFLSSPPP